MKITAIVVVPFAILLVAVRPYRRWNAVRAGAEVAGGALAAMAAITAAAGLGVGWIGAMMTSKDLVQFTSPPTAVGMTVTYAGRLVDPDFDAIGAVRAVGLVVLAVTLVTLWWRSALSDDPIPAALRGAGLALAALVALMPFFHPWYAMWPLVLLAASTMRTGLVMAAATAGTLLVLPDGGGLARFAKFPGAPLMTVLLAVLLVVHLRRDGRDVRLRAAAARLTRRRERVG